MLPCEQRGQSKAALRFCNEFLLQSKAKQSKSKLSTRARLSRLESPCHFHEQPHLMNRLWERHLHAESSQMGAEAKFVGLAMNYSAHSARNADV